MDLTKRPCALVTGGSRGIGAATARTLAELGCDVVLTYRNKRSRADEVVAEVERHGMRGLAVACDVTQSEDIAQLMQNVQKLSGSLDLLILNASGGLERDLVAANPDYPMLINRDAQLSLVEAALPLLRKGSTVLFVTSHWAHLYGQMAQLPAYEPIAESKYAGESALREQQSLLAARRIRLLVVTGDLIQGTITPKLLERTAPGLLEQRQQSTGMLPTTEEMGRVIAESALDVTLASGTTIVVGEALASMLASSQGA